MEPVGGSGGTRWSFVASRDIVCIQVCGGFLNKDREIGIRSISFTDADGFQYGHYGQLSLDSDIHYYGQKLGASMETSLNVTHGISLSRGEEYLTSIKGSFGTRAGIVVITSLTFNTNRRPYGPYGEYSANSTDFDFQFQMDGGYPVGFHGRSGDWLDALGVYVMPRSIEESISVLPWELTSRSSGHHWSFKINKGMKLIIGANRHIIKSISFEDVTGQRSQLFGDKNRSPNDEESVIEIEYITSVTGTWTTEGITSLTFVANNQTQRLVGKAIGDVFSVPIKDSVVVGFHGRGDNRLDALGYFVKPRFPETKVTVGPWGGTGGAEWSFIPTDDLNEVIIRYRYAVHSIAFRDTRGSLSKIYGGRDTGTIDGTRKVIDIDWPSEYLTSMSGTYGHNVGHFVITSLTFKTNWNSYGPYGEEKGTYFSSKTNHCVIVGFFGNAGPFLDSIGIYARPLRVMNNKSSEVAGNGDAQEKCKKTKEGKDDNELPGNIREERTASLRNGTKVSPTEASMLTRSNIFNRINKIPALLQDFVVNLRQTAKKATGKGGDGSSIV